MAYLTGLGGLRDRARRGVTQLLAFALAAGLLAAVVLRLPEPVADRLIEADVRAESRVWQARILRQLSAGSEAFRTGEITAADRAYLESISHASDVQGLSLTAIDGRTFWSSRPELIGSMDEPPGEDAENLERWTGEIDYEVEFVAADEIDPAAGQVLDVGDDGVRVVVDIDHLVVHDGDVVGAMEFYRDITGVREAFVERVRWVLALVSAAALAMLAAIAVVLVRAGRVERQAAEARAEAQRTLMAEQVRLTREVRVLGELNEWLQSSRSLPELFSMVARFMTHILPGSAGSLYVYSNSRDVLDGAASWSGGSHHDHIRPEDCWGLRRGRSYAFGENAVDFACGHHDGAAPGRYVCIPILAHGETIGLMSLTAAPDAEPQAFEAQRRLAQTCAEQISMAIANVRMRDALQHQAIRDPLTGLFNQRHLLEQLRRHIESRAAREVALVSLDVDHFKRFNDNFGHDAGDMVLRAVGEALARHADGDDVACRIGGEEFTLLLPGLTTAQAVERAERARHDVSQISVRYGDKALPRVTVSVGVAHCPTNGVVPQEVIRAADDALYAAKAKGRNCVVLAGPGAERATPAADWANDLAADAPAIEPPPIQAELKRA